MDFLDLISELRTGKPDIRKAEKAMKGLGWLCVVGALWNYALYFIGPFRDKPFNLPELYPYAALVSLLIVGALFFRSARGIREMEPWGKRTARLAVVLLIVFLVGVMLLLLPLNSLPFRGDLTSLMFALVFVVAAGQLLLPAYFGFLYLGRLPVKEEGYSPGRYRTERAPQHATEQIRPRGISPETKYADSPFPFGIAGTFALSIAIPLLFVVAALGFAGPELVPYAIAPAFLLVFCAPVAYNYYPSPFQEKRSLLTSCTGGGAIFLFNGSWPFFRLMVYKDGVEVRVMFHRYFVPYDEMADLPDKLGFFSRGLLIKSDLPGVPSRIRFSGFGMKNLVRTVSELRAKHLAERRA